MCTNNTFSKKFITKLAKIMQILLRKWIAKPPIMCGYYTILRHDFFETPR